jgi:hypothetical protein
MHRLHLTLDSDSRQHHNRQHELETDMHISRKIVIATLALGLVLTVGAYAQDKKGTLPSVTTLFTPPLVPEGKSQLDCYIINVSHKPRRVVIEALDRDGVVVADWTEVLSPSTEAVAIAKSADRPRSCRFVVEGSSDNFRASGLVHLPGFGSISALAAQ